MLYGFMTGLFAWISLTALSRTYFINCETKTPCEGDSGILYSNMGNGLYGNQSNNVCHRFVCKLYHPHQIPYEDQDN